MLWQPHHNIMQLRRFYAHSHTKILESKSQRWYYPAGYIKLPTFLYFQCHTTKYSLLSIPVDLMAINQP